MAGKMNFGGSFGDWEEIDSPDRGRDSDAPLSKPQRVAPETDVLKRKVAADTGPSERSSEHSSLVRAKKRGTRDSDVNAKTFVISGNKIVGSQG